MTASRSFSQIAITNDSIFCIPTSTAKAVVKDLLEGDQAKKQLKLTQNELGITNIQLFLQDSIIEEKDKQIQYQENISSSDSSKILVWEQEFNQLQKANKKLKINDRFKTVVGIAVIGFLVYLNLK